MYCCAIIVLRNYKINLHKGVAILTQRQSEPRSVPFAILDFYLRQPTEHSCSRDPVITVKEFTAKKLQRNVTGDCWSEGQMTKVELGLVVKAEIV